jgi:ABC-type transport system involved in cytochrome c biogenesis permease component
MRRWIRTFLVLLMKEIKLEARGREVLVLLLCSSLMTAVLVGAGVSSAVLDMETTRKLYPMLLWVVFLLSTTSASVRAQESELEGRAFEGLLLVGVTGPQMYISKLVVTALLFWFDWSVLVFLLAAVLDQDVSSIVGILLLVGGLSSLCLGSLVVLLSALTGTSRMRGVLLPLLTIPLLFPLFFAGIELTTHALIFGVFDTSSVWLSLLLLVFTTFTIVGINAYELAIRE